MKKVLVIGLDGLEPQIVEPLLAAGELPHLSKMRARGGYGRVATTAPAQTPVAWSSFATGTNPGGHGIFDFIRRDPKTYLPDLALNRYEQKNAFLPPRAVNLRRGTPLWELLSDAGIGSTILRCPCTYPPDPIRGQMLSGMGVPDLRGGLGTATFYTSADGAAPRESENVVRVQADGSGAISTYLIGPRNPKDRTDARLEMTLIPDREARTITVRSAGTPKELLVREGQWSEWLQIKFKLGLLQTIRGTVRFFLVRLDPVVELYASPINFDPEAPLFPISSPAEYARELAEDIGLYYTAGMVEDHAGLSNGRIGEEAFLDQCEEVWSEREAMMLRELDRLDEGLFFCLYDTPDRVQHMFWRFREADHPANRGQPLPAAYVRVIEDQYRRADAIVGKALEYADDRTLVIALSDHGFNSFRRGVDLNTWLHENHLLALRPGVRPGEEAGDLLRQIDWGRTKAYALGLGGIYLNLEGREGQGIVKADEAETLKADIARGLRDLIDPASGQAAIRGVKPREELYRGPYAQESPDLVVHFAEGYRVSWSTSMGGVAGEVFEDNEKAWGGDHIIDPALVPGVLFMNRPFRRDGARLVDLAPTILAALGVPKGAAMEGSPLLP
ncbi:MAG: alkaline phosphatase family protein [Isosphaeraceae bacterium]|nr:alkaline phosphatase family protein [Isosphaeraceae bacterium]